MQRTATSYLLIAIVLICPYFCLGDGCDVIGVSSEPCGCSCVNDRDCPNDDQQPCQGGDSDCLCRGAITDSVRTTDCDFALPVTVYWLVDVEPADEIMLAAVAAEPPHQFPPFSTGRDVCALICSRLL